jgi:bacterioferritin
MDFTTNVEEIRKRARNKIEEGAITEGYGLDRKQSIRILNEALATEIVCVLRYQYHYYMASGIHSTAVAAEFLEHAKAEQEHASKISERIKQLQGKPELNPAIIAQRSHTEYKEGESLPDMIREDLIAERIVIDIYREMIKFFGEKDPTTRRMLEQILGDEEEHADELADMLFAIEPGVEARPLYSKDETREGAIALEPAGKR